MPHKEEFIVYGLLMVEVEAEDLRNGFCRRQLKITNTKVKQYTVYYMVIIEEGTVAKI